MSQDGNRLEQRLQITLELLRGQSTMTLSTCDEAGWAQATPLFYYVDDGLTLYWFSAAKSAHSKHVLREPRVAAAVFVPTEYWKEIRGVQMRGHVSVVTGAMRRKITALYRERFGLGTMFRLIMPRSLLFRFQPTWIRYLDNAKGIGHKFEVSLAERTTA